MLASLRFASAPLNSVVRRHVRTAGGSSKLFKLFVIGRALQIVAVMLVAHGMSMLFQLPGVYLLLLVLLYIGVPALALFIGGAFLVNLSRYKHGEGPKLPDAGKSRDV